ncbi:DNA polymerase [Thiomonas sp.]
MSAQPQLFAAQDFWEAGSKPAPWVRIPSRETEAAETRRLIASIQAAPWKVVDVETTGLTPASAPVNANAKSRRAGADTDLRVRVVSVLWPEGPQVRIESFDLDPFRTLPGDWVTAICSAALSETFIAHNAGFDLFWLRQHSQVAPKRVLDTMLIARVLEPLLPRRLIGIAAQYQDKPDDAVVQALLKTVQAEKSGWALADVAAVLLGVVMPKELQLPQNWTGFALGPDHYTYAVDDVIRTYQVLAILLGLWPEGDPRLPGVLPVLEAYCLACKDHPEMLRQEPQVWDLIPIREKGMPIDFEQISRYVADKKAELALQARQMTEIEPELQPFEADIADWDKGISAPLKKALGKAFIKRGLDLAVTDAKGDYKIGEKDLRLVGAQDSAEARNLYGAWVALNKAKKVGNMAEDVAAFARRAPDLRVHPLLSHGPATGRLSCAEPNAQQFPADEQFRAIVRAGHEAFDQGETGPRLICAVDYSALDMRVGAALAIRAQREIAEARETGRYHGHPVADKVLHIIRKVYGLRVLAKPRDRRKATDKPWIFGNPDSVPADGLKAYLRDARSRLITLERQFRDHQGERDNVEASERNKYWETYREMRRRIVLGTFACRLTEILIRATENGETEWSALRDTFRLGVDVHTSTALRMQNQDPKAMFSGLGPKELEAKQKEAKHALGDKRKGGKVANLGLLYYMQAQGFKDYAAKLFNIHWTLDETIRIRENWLNSHPEIDLWAVWTSLNAIETVTVPDKSRRTGFRTEELFRAETLGGRVMYPLGLNAGLAYGDQGSGADILGEVVHELQMRYPRLYATAINQVHDEMVFELDRETAEADARQLGEIMDECANRFLMPYGVPSACTPALGEVWVKD